MIKVTRATKKEIKDFNAREWKKVDVEHYGPGVKWKEKKFAFKVTEKDEILGTVTGKYESGVVYIGSIIVAASKRRKGVGLALMHEVEEFGRKSGVHKIWLVTGKDWLANKFYERVGFKQEAELPNHFFRKGFVIYSKFIN